MEAMTLYPLLKTELETVIGWKIDFRSTIFLINDTKTFRQMAGNDLVVAFASADSYLIVIDYSRMKTDPFTLEATLQHELCHLLLHHYIKGEDLPRWLDEGIAQWASGGLADIIMQKNSTFENAVLSGKMIDIRALANSFPDDKRSMSIAYAESRNFVQYIIREHSLKGLLQILQYLREGYETDESIIKALSMPFDKLETMWQRDIKRRISWLTFLINNLYEVLFVLGAFLLILGYIRVIIKKRKYDTGDDAEKFQ
jgi:hypothetical protein